MSRFQGGGDPAKKYSDVSGVFCIIFLESKVFFIISQINSGMRLQILELFKFKHW